MSGKGNAAARGGIAGDLIIQIEEIKHPLFERDGNNILYDHFINIADAALGASFEVPTIDGKVKVKIEPGSQSGKTLRLKGKGIPSVNGYEGSGDLFVTVHVWTPKILSKEEKAILEKLAKSPNFKPDPNFREKNFFSRMKDYFES